MQFDLSGLSFVDVRETKTNSYLVWNVWRKTYPKGGELDLDIYFALDLVGTCQYLLSSLLFLCFVLQF